MEGTTAEDPPGNGPVDRGSITAPVVIIGAGAAGLAVGACLTRAGIEVEILERAAVVGSSWRSHYDRLHLHTDRRNSGLPSLPMPSSYPRFPSRDQVVEYLEAYSDGFDLAPRFGTEVTWVARTKGGWLLDTSRGRFESPNLVVATGYAGTPVRPTWPGLTEFPGPCVHSSEYRSGAAFRGQRVLVVGFGNSGGEIALDLLESGASVAMAVRSPVNVIPRELAGVPILSIAVPLSRLPAWLADALTAPIGRLLYGDLERFGLRRAEAGPFGQIAGQKRIPLIDIGTIERIRAGDLEVRPGIREFAGDRVTFDGGPEERFDALILATGYRPGLEPILGSVPGAVDEQGEPIREGVRGSLPGLYYCGFYVSPTGMLREIGQEARVIVREISRGLRGL